MKTEHIQKYEAFFEDNPELKTLLLEKPQITLTFLNNLDDTEHPLTRSNRKLIAKEILRSFLDRSEKLL